MTRIPSSGTAKPLITGNQYEPVSFKEGVSLHVNPKQAAYEKEVAA
jgi:hypothetical protein